jgi:hypothetical protein
MITEKELCLMLHKILEDCNAHGANAMETLRDHIRITAGIPDPPGYWYLKSDGLVRNKVSDMVNHFVECIEEPGTFYDDNGKYRCAICGGWNGLHHNCPIASLRSKVYSFDEFCDTFLEMLEIYSLLIPKN